MEESVFGIKPQFPEQEQLKCPRCDSINTKFCYYNNYNLSQPRHYCKNCRRYWTKGGSLRNIPVGGGSRKNGKKPSNQKMQNPGQAHGSSSSFPGHDVDHKMMDSNGSFSSLLNSNGDFGSGLECLNSNGSDAKMGGFVDLGRNMGLELIDKNGSDGYLGMQSGESRVAATADGRSLLFSHQVQIFNNVKF